MILHRMLILHRSCIIADLSGVHKLYGTMVRPVGRFNKGEYAVGSGRGEEECRAPAGSLKGALV